MCINCKKEDMKDLVFSKFRPLCHNAGDMIYGLNGDIKSKKFESNSRFGQILKNSELYAPNFEAFNDIDEGVFYISEEYQHLINQIRHMKKRAHICSFSYGKCDYFCEDLMWAHYANAHCGVKIDFKIDTENITSKEPTLICMKYGDTMYDFRNLSNTEHIDMKTVQELLSKKKCCWKYEGEYRVILNDKKLPIIIKRITLGKKFASRVVTNDEIEKMDFDENIKKVAKQILGLLKDSGKYEYELPEIWSYRTRYSDEPKKIEFNEMF